MAVLRLDKFLADAGIGTRSAVKEYIKKGFVTVNGMPAAKADTKVDAVRDVIEFQGEQIVCSEFEYYILNKPAGYVCARTDNLSPTVMELIDSRRRDLSPVGRLDKDTEGLLFITNDGALSHFLLSPKRHVDKIYYAEVSGIMDERDVAAFSEGVYIGDEDLDTALPAHLEIEHINIEENRSLVYITIHEGKFHQIKRMVHALGKEVVYLKRVQFGALRLPDDLGLGQARALTDAEIQALKQNTLPI